MSYHNSWRPTLTTLALASLAVTSSYFGYQLVSHYGWEGAFYYIWEGSPYPPELRTEFETLDDVEDKIDKEARILDRLEEAYERAQLDSVDGSSDATILDLWNANLPKGNLEKLVGRISHNLDLFASRVDAVPSKQNAALKARKKELSNAIVTVMQRADVYVAHFQNGQKSQPPSSKEESS
jgi:hypothetical protein